MVHLGHIAMVHLGHTAVIHAGMSSAHVRHVEERRLALGRNRRRHAGITRQGGPGVTGARHRLGEDGIGAGFFRTDDHVVGLGDRDAELIDLDRLDIIAVGLNHGHRQPRNAHIEEGHRRGIDEAQPHPLAGLEQGRPILSWGLAVDQESVAADIGDIGRRHAHLAPVEAIGESFGEAILSDIINKRRQSALLVVVVVGLFFQIGEDALGRGVVPIGQHDDIFAVESERLAPLGIDDDRAV